MPSANGEGRITMRDNPTILIIDDNPVNSALLETILEKDGYQTLQAENGPDGRVLAQVHLPDLILLDIMMPDECGFETCGALKLDPRTAGIPVIFLSGINEAEEKVKGLALGAVDYITKPFNREELRARTRLHIGLKQMYATSVSDLNTTAKNHQNCRQAASTKPQGSPERRLNPKRPSEAVANNRAFVDSTDTRTFVSALPEQVVLSPGEYYVSKESVTIRTILGSCVAACLWDPPNGIIGMNHFLLASKGGANNVSFSQTDAGKY
jgi:DNA-binding response OmpR family regulator